MKGLISLAQKYWFYHSGIKSGQQKLLFTLKNHPAGITPKVMDLKTSPNGFAKYKYQIISDKLHFVGVFQLYTFGSNYNYGQMNVRETT